MMTPREIRYVTFVLLSLTEEVAPGQQAGLIVHVQVARTCPSASQIQVGIDPRAD